MPSLEQLPGGQAGALEEGSRLVGEDVDCLPALDGGADDAEGGAVAGGGEGAGVAVGEDGALLSGTKMRRGGRWPCRRRCPRRASCWLPR